MAGGEDCHFEGLGGVDGVGVGCEMFYDVPQGQIDVLRRICDVPWPVWMCPRVYVIFSTAYMTLLVVYMNFLM